MQERFEGFTVADDEAPGSVADRPRQRWPTTSCASMLEQILRLGFFHADPHPGNVFVLEDGTLGMIDFGAVGRLDPIQQKAMVDIMAALARRDVELLRDGIERVAEMTEAVPPERLERSFARLMADHLRPGGAVDPSILQDLIATLSQFGIRLPGDLVILSRAHGDPGRHPAASSAPGVSLVRRGDQPADGATAARRSSIPRRSCARSSCRCSPTCAASPTASTARSCSPAAATCASGAWSTRTPAASCGRW